MHILTLCLFLWILVALYELVRALKSKRYLVATACTLLAVALVPVIGKYLILTGIQF